jgi:hypothetical protein
VPIVDAALVAEHITRAFYYAGLTQPKIIGDVRLAGRSGDPNNPGLPPGGRPDHVTYLQAALDAEVKHANMWTAAGGVSGIKRAFFPASAFDWLGSGVVPTSYLGLLDQLETTVIGLYTAAVPELIGMQKVELSVLAGEIGGIQASHRMLGRVISGLLPANNRALETQPFASVAQARAALEPFVTGRGLAGKILAVPIPSSAQTMRVIGRHGTHIVRTFQ